MSKDLESLTSKGSVFQSFGVAQVNNLSPSVALGLKPVYSSKRVSLVRLNTVLLAWIDLLGHELHSVKASYVLCKSNVLDTRVLNRSWQLATDRHLLGICSCLTLHSICCFSPFCLCLSLPAIPIILFWVFVVL